MALFYSREINATTKLAIWKIEEQEDFFSAFVPLSNTITHPKKRLQHLAGRYLLQYLFPDFPIHSIQIASTRKPFLEDEKYHFSISHCGDYAAAIVSSTERLGIDIELQRATVSKIAHRFLNEEELSTVPADDLATLTVLWSAKEAIFKWWGKGHVDFSETIRVESFEMSEEGILAGKLLKDNLVYSFNPQYKIFETLCLVWVNK